MALKDNVMNKKSAGVYLPEVASKEIWAKAQEASIIQRLAQKAELPGNGVSIPVIVGDPEAEWTDELGKKKAGKSTLDRKKMTPYKLTLIEVFSDEFRDDSDGLVSQLISRLPAAIGRKFDKTILTGTAPGENFDVLSGATEISLSGGESAYAQILAGMGLVADIEDANLSALAMSAAGEIALLGATDKNGRPIFTSNPATDGSIGSVLGRPVYRSKAVGVKATDPANKDVLGVAGDWASARWGTVAGIQIAMSEEATVEVNGETINLWQQNAFAVRVEARLGFVCKDVNAFVRFTA